MSKYIAPNSNMLSFVFTIGYNDTIWLPPSLHRIGIHVVMVYMYLPNDLRIRSAIEARYVDWLL